MSHYKKLVRDKIPEILDEKGASYKKTILDDKEYEAELRRKLVEEANEFHAEPSAEELADVVEVVEALKRLPEYKNTDSVRATKREERGGFDKRILLEGEKS